MSLVWLLAACFVNADVEQSGRIPCAQPQQRDVAPFVSKQLAQPALGAANLHGGGLLIEDLDGDGWLDLFAPGESQHVLRWGRRGNLDALFDDADASLDGLPLAFSVGATAVDYDADGDLDLYVTRWQRPNTLLRNEGSRRFVDVSAEAFPGAPSTSSQSASWGDIDRDGDLDLFVGTYGSNIVIINVNDPVPDCTDHVPDAGLLWVNNGDGTFINRSDELPPETRGYTFMSGFYDLDDDGYPELFLAHDDGVCGPSVVLRNQRGTFVVDENTGFDRGAHDMGMAVADLNGDERPDFLFTSWNDAGLLMSRPGNGGVSWLDAADSRSLRVNGAPPDRPAQAQQGQQIFGWGAEFGDLDNDADVDAVMVFGYWDYFPGAGNRFLQRDGVWQQRPDGTFVDVAGSLGLAHDNVSRGVVLADLNRDGYLDVAKHFLDAGLALRVSQCGAQGSWVRIRLRGPAPNTFGVGARISVHTGDRVQTRWITSGSTGMYSGAPLEAHVGLGQAEVIDRIEVTWPDNRRSVHENIDARQVLTIRR